MTDMFICPACGEEHEGDAVTGITECRACRRVHCDDCLDENGLCTDCKEEE